MLSDYGYSFDSDLTFGEIFTRLNAIGPWAWEERDSAWYGNIVKVRTSTIRLDLFESGGNELAGGTVQAGNGAQYAISVRRGNTPPSEHEWAAAELAIRTELLPALGARNVKPTDPID